MRSTEPSAPWNAAGLASERGASGEEGAGGAEPLVSRSSANPGSKSFYRLIHISSIYNLCNNKQN